MPFAPEVKQYNLRSEQNRLPQLERHPKDLFSARSYYWMLVSSIDKVLLPWKKILRLRHL